MSPHFWDTLASPHGLMIACIGAFIGIVAVTALALGAEWLEHRAWRRRTAEAAARRYPSRLVGLEG